MAGESRDVERLIAFTDGVMAIAITLLVLDIRLPRPAGELDDASLLSDLLAIWPEYFGYALSFLVIGNFWVAHARRLRTLKSVDAELLWLNVFFLLVIGFMPFVTSVLSENDGRVATILYAATMIVASLLLTLVWRYAVHREHAVLPRAERRVESLRALAVPGVFALSIVVAWYAPGHARDTWLLLIPLLALNRYLARDRS
jgi:uncharacterized membrane protein